MKIFVIIPAYNEVKRIAQVLKGLLAFDYKIVVVDDGSIDNTPDIVCQYPVTLLRHKINRGQGAALETGNQYALSQGADIIVHFDGDGQFLAEEIEQVIFPIVQGNYDVVLGSRFLSKKSNLPWFKKLVIFPLARLVNDWLLGFRLSDPQNGFRAMSRQAALRIKIENDGKAHCSEIAAKAHSYSLKIKEVPVTVIYHEFGQGMGEGFKILKDLLFSKFIK